MSSGRAPSHNIATASSPAGHAQTAPTVPAPTAPRVPAPTGAVPAQAVSLPDESVRSVPATAPLTTQIIPASAAPATTTTTGNSSVPVAPTQTLPTTTTPSAAPATPATTANSSVPTADGPLTTPAESPTPPSAPPGPLPPSPILNDTVNELIIISDPDTYDKLLTDAGRKHLLLEFFAPWCGACMLINRKLEELVTTYNDKLIIAKVNIEDCEQIAIDNEVSMMPSFVLMKENQVLERFAGSNEDKLVSIIKKYVGEPLNSKEETT